MRHVFIINPAAGRQNSSKIVIDRINAAFKDYYQEAIIELAQYKGHAMEITARYASEGIPTVFYCCSGDGTLGEVVEPIIGLAHCAFAPIPIGTGNDYVRYFGKDSHERFLDIGMLLNGTREKVDVLMADGKCCLNIASSGFDAMVARRVELFKNIPFISGETAYNLSTAYCFFTSVKNNMGFEIDGKLYQNKDYIFAVIANGMYYGGGFKASPISDIRDGMIDFITVPTVSRFKMLSMMESYRKGEHLDKYDFITHTRCKSVRLIADREIPLNIDGNITMAKNPYIEIVPKAVEIVLPYEA